MKTHFGIKLVGAILACFLFTSNNLSSAQSGTIAGQYKQVTLTYSFFPAPGWRLDAWAYKNWTITQNGGEIVINGYSGTIDDSSNFQVSGVLVGESNGWQNYSGNYDPDLKKISGTFTGTVGRIGMDGKTYLDEIFDGAFSGTKSKTIVADFTSSATSGDIPLTIDFTDQSTGNIVEWNWDFGDEGTSTEQNPNHTYTQAGTYTVSLTVTGADESDIKTKTDYITVTVPVLEADFTVDVTNGDADLQVNFTDNSTGIISAWSWNFGDEGTSTDQNPSHTYTQAGTYTVSLTITGVDESDIETKTDYITVTVPAPIADFTADITNGDADLLVNFTDNSTGDISAWSWNFGDEGTSTEQNPSHTYTQAGTYTVSLTVTGTGGSDIETKTDHITVTAPAPIADFTADITSGDRDLLVIFTDNSKGDISTWSWNFRG